MRTIEEKLSKARSFNVGTDNNPVYIELANNNPEKWAIRCHHNVLDKNNQWVYEPMPSGRSDEFKERTRFDSLDEAWDFYDKYLNR